MKESRPNEEVELILGEPFHADFSEVVRKVRNSLIIVSGTSLFSVLSGIDINPNASILGFNFVGLTPHLVYVGLLIINLYLLLHFCWYSHDKFIEWWLRLSGTRTAFLTGSCWGDEGADYPKDPRQSTLYNWWLHHSRHIGRLFDKTQDMNNKWDEFKALAKDVYEGKDPNITTLISSLGTAQHHAFELVHSVKQVEEIFKNQRIPTSLKRFDR